MPKKEYNDIEEEILNSRGTSNVSDEDVDMIKARDKQKSADYVDRLNKLNPKNFKKRRLFLAFVSAVVIASAFLIGGSFALKSNISKTDSTIEIEAGTLKLDFENSSSAIGMNNALPQTNQDAIANNSVYEFTLKNNGNINTEYTLSLDNSCTSNQTYMVNKKKVRPDVCIPDKYIKVGLSTNGEYYKILTRNENDNIYVLEKGVLAPNTKNTYKLKIWLDYDTPNTYNSNGSTNIVYSGNINVDYKQISNSNNK